jgi:hypothetical protein
MGLDIQVEASYAESVHAKRSSVRVYPPIAKLATLPKVASLFDQLLVDC